MNKKSRNQQKSLSHHPLNTPFFSVSIPLQKQHKRYNFEKLHTVSQNISFPHHSFKDIHFEAQTHYIWAYEEKKCLSNFFSLLIMWAHEGLKGKKLTLLSM